MSEKDIDHDYSGAELREETIEDRVFIGDNFDRAFFNHRTYLRCAFIGCSFALTSFSNSNFVRCYFRANTFVAAFGDQARFIECHSSLDNFVKFDFGQCHFDFISTDGSLFASATMPRDAHYPANCREVIAEIVRKAGDAPWIVACAGLIHGWTEFCWETLCRTIIETFGKDRAALLAAHLRTYPSLQPRLEKTLQMLSTGL